MCKNVFYHISFIWVFVSYYLYIKPLYLHILHNCVYVCVPSQPLTAMPECSQTPRRQRPDYLADFTSGSSIENSCSSSDEEDEERRKAGGGGGRRGGEKREKKVSYDLGESKEKNLAERSGKVGQSCNQSSCLFSAFFNIYS